MKKFLLAVGLSCITLGASAQGTIYFANYVNGILLAPIFGVSPSSPTVQKRGQSPLGIPAGTTEYDGALLNGSGYSVALYAGPKNTPANALQLVSTSAFRSASDNDLPAGLWMPSAVSVPGVGPGQRVTVEIRAWDNKGGTVNTWDQVLADPTAARGTSGAFSPLGILGAALGTIEGPGADSPLILVGLTSFNIAMVPEPAFIGFCVLGSPALS